MTRSEIIEDVKSLTEHKADQKVNFDRMFSRRLQKFCQAKPFWWRKIYFSFYTYPGTAIYDLSSSAVDANGNAMPGLVNFEAFECDPLIWNYPTSVLNGYKTLNPVWDGQAIAASKIDTTQGMPTTYTIEPGKFTVVRLGPVPDAQYMVNGLCFQIPNPSSDASDDVVPVVPAIYHHALVSGLKMDVAGFLYGIKSDMFQVAQAEYNEGLMAAESRQNFGMNEVAQYIIADESTRSTPGS